MQFDIRELYRGGVFAVILSVGLLLGLVRDVRAQDAFFSQFYNAPLYLNPGFAGVSKHLTMALNYRNEYPLFADPFSVYSSYAFSADKFFENYNSGVGVIFSGSHGGDGAISTLNSSLLYTYRVQLSGQHYVRGAMQLGGIFRRYGWDNFLFPDQLQPIVQGEAPANTHEIAPDKTQVIRWDFSFGVLFHHPRYFAGISWKHLNAPDLSILNIRDFESRNNNLPMRWSLHGGYKWYINKNAQSPTFISVNATYVEQAAQRQVNFTGIFKFSKVFAGVGLRHAFQNFDALILSTGLMTNQMTIGYSFDMTMSKFGIVNGGSHEIAIRYRIADMRRVETNTSCYSFYQ